MKITKQKGAARSDPSRIERWLISKVATRKINPENIRKRRERTENQRLMHGLPHQVDYFHQVDDPYSHLAVQALKPFQENYDIELTCHLVLGPAGKNLPEPEMLSKYARYDCEMVAPYYQLNFPHSSDRLSNDNILMSQRILAAQQQENFLDVAKAVGDALWLNDPDKLSNLADQYGIEDEQQTKTKIDQDSKKQQDLKHFAGAMMYYGSEWYWGVDRLYVLEQRLHKLGASNLSDGELLYPRPEIQNGSKKDNGSITLEIYPSLRSPYTAVGFDRAIAMAQRVGVNLVIKPVLPMVMRGVTLSSEKAFYIFVDAAREAYAQGINDYGQFYDPIGSPVLRGLSLLPWVREQDKEIEFISAFLKAAFYDGVNLLALSGLKSVVNNIGLNWEEAKLHLDNSDWQDELEKNRLALNKLDCWGVPSFNIIDKNGNSVAHFWGQDRIWVVAQEIQRLICEDDNSS